MVKYRVLWCRVSVSVSTVVHQVCVAHFGRTVSLSFIIIDKFILQTPNVKRAPTTESLVELEGERRAMYRTVMGKLLCMCQERADVMYSVKETARKNTCPTGSNEMNLKRIVRYLKGVPSAKSLIEIITPSKFVNVYTDSGWAGQATTCRSTSGGVVPKEW